MKCLHTFRLWVAVVPLLLGVVAHAEDGSIRLRTRVQVTGERIVLAEIARLGGSAVDFADLDLGHAPDAGASRRITGASILARLRDAGLDEEGVRYRIPASVRIERAHQEVDPEDLRGAIERRMAEWLPAGDEVDSIELPTRVRVPLGAYEIQVGSPEPLGRHQHEVELTVEQQGRVVAREAARLRVSSRGPVVVVRRAVTRGTVVQAEDVRVEERSLRGLPATRLIHADEAVGRLARVSLVPGTVVTSRAVEAPILVERGDRVRVAVETAGMRLTVPAEALESAGLGERVRVVNPTSGREFTAEVIAHGKVLVHY